AHRTLPRKTAKWHPRHRCPPEWDRARAGFQRWGERTREPFDNLRNWVDHQSVHRHHAGETGRGWPPETRRFSQSVFPEKHDHDQHKRHSRSRPERQTLFQLGLRRYGTRWGPTLERRGHAQVPARESQSGANTHRSRPATLPEKTRAQLRPRLANADHI